MPAYSIREWEALPHGDGEGFIPPQLALRLAALAKTSAFAGRGGGGVLEDRRDDLRARGVVGVLAVPGCTLEILPKIDVGQKEGSAQETREIRKRLVHMLAVALDLKIETGRMTDLNWQRETLLEILIRIFCNKLTEAVRRGMPRRYTFHEDDLPTLRGSLNIPRQFTRHLANPGRLACRYDELSEDIALNRIMKATIGHLARSECSAPAGAGLPLCRCRRHLDPGPKVGRCRHRPHQSRVAGIVQHGAAIPAQPVSDNQCGIRARIGVAFRDECAV